jgi:PAS domain S-box-containing protein
LRRADIIKNPVTPNAREKLMRDDEFVVSKTDLTGRITYCNRVFIEYSGYTETELLGSQHNIIRHPDMPRGVFKFLWDTIQARKECFAYVKNMAKDGSFYWVFANVTPDYGRDGAPEGYYSVRRAPKRSAVDQLADVYQLMLAEERRAGPRDACTASLALLNRIIAEKGTSYDEFIISL